MTDPKTVTEREAVKREQRAFAKGWVAKEIGGGLETCLCSVCEDKRSGVMDRAAKVYPLPKVTRPRVVMDPESDLWQFRMAGAVMYEARSRMTEGGPWGEWQNFAHTMTVDRARALVELADNPSEEVDGQL